MLQVVWKRCEMCVIPQAAHENDTCYSKMQGLSGKIMCILQHFDHTTVACAAGWKIKCISKGIEPIF